MLGRGRIPSAVLLVALAVAACGGGGGDGGGGGASPTALPQASLPPELPVVSCLPGGPFVTSPCSIPIETMYAQVAANGPFDEVRATVVGVADCANPREFPAATERPKEYFWMVRFAKGDTDFGGFVATGGRLGLVCAPFTGT
ncbi:MAG: hypothetical protein ABIG85_03045 [Chloroflexota bacterium]